MFRLNRTGLFVLVAFFIVISSFAFDAQASEWSGQYPIRGEGDGKVSGFVITDLQYHLAADPSYISEVSFQLDASADQVVVSFDVMPNQSYECRNSHEFHWSCELENVKTGQITDIRITATG